MFQLTLPEWGATGASAYSSSGSEFQLTLPEWGATSGDVPDCTLEAVSTHAPRVGSDLYIDKVKQSTLLFQLTLPEWGATSVRKTK